MIYNRFLSVDRWYAFVVILRCVFRTVAFSSHLRIFHRPSSYFFSSYLSKYIYKHTYTYGSSLASFRSHKMSDDPVIDVKARNARARLMATMSRVLNVIFNAEFLSDTQKKAAENIVNQKSHTILRFHTELERSLTYQLAAVMKSPKVTVVFCNDIERIMCNVSTLSKYSVHCEMLHDMLSSQERKRVYKALLSKHVMTTLVYVTTQESFTNHFQVYFSHLVRTNRLAYFVLDETNREATWLKMNTDDYDLMVYFHSTCPDIPWVVVTGPASVKAMEQISSVLGIELSSFVQYSEPCFTPKLQYDVVRVNNFHDSVADLAKFAKKCLKDSENDNYPCSNVRGLVFYNSIRNVDDITTEISKNGICVSPYPFTYLDHKQQFTMKIGIMKGAVNIIAITSLEELDITVNNVTFIAHIDVPNSLQKYYDETGRIARMNGKHVKCRLYIRNDIIDFHTCITAPIIKKKKNDKYLNLKSSNEVFDYCESTKCRHEFLAKYFGDPKPVCIDKCDNHYFDDPLLNYRTKLFGTITTSTNDIIEEASSTTRNISDKNMLTSMDTACHMTRLIKEFETSGYRNKEEASNQVKQIEILCKELQKIEIVGTPKDKDITKELDIISSASNAMIGNGEPIKYNHEFFAKYLRNAKSVSENKCDNHYDDPLLTYRMKLFSKITLMTNDLLEETLQMEQIKDMKILKMMEIVCHMTKLIKGFEILGYGDKMEALHQVKQIEVLCEELQKVATVETPKDEKPCENEHKDEKSTT